MRLSLTSAYFIVKSSFNEGKPVITGVHCSHFPYVQIVCSFMVRDLGLDWRMGAEWFETCLLDYDPCSNYGNWTYGAGK